MLGIRSPASIGIVHDEPMIWENSLDFWKEFDFYSVRCAPKQVMNRWRFFWGEKKRGWQFRDKRKIGLVEESAFPKICNSFGF